MRCHIYSDTDCKTTNRRWNKCRRRLVCREETMTLLIIYCSEPNLMWFIGQNKVTTAVSCHKKENLRSLLDQTVNCVDSHPVRAVCPVQLCSASTWHLQSIYTSSRLIVQQHRKHFTQLKTSTTSVQTETKLASNHQIWFSRKNHSVFLLKVFTNVSSWRA